MNEKRRWLIVAIFAAAMAWLESATVIYLRTLVGRIDPYQAQPLPVSVGLGQTEIIREAATLIMLFTVGWLAGRTWRSRLGYSMIAFGLWDILYYVFLAIIGGWPRSLLDWDVLFLIPLPWWGPVIAPVLIATMMIIGGTLVSRFDRTDRPIWPGRRAWTLNLGGVALALYVFMADALQVMGGGAEAVRAILPAQFNWPLFISALVLMAAPIVDVSRQIWKQRVVGSARAETA
ncbi:MAG TPA: hypothetical protein VJG32_14680 [Anaerolineae bacterium]|nr:hypothetical protein [Anaerolineae bacterium]